MWHVVLVDRNGDVVRELTQLARYRAAAAFAAGFGFGASTEGMAVVTQMSPEALADCDCDSDEAGAAGEVDAVSIEDALSLIRKRWPHLAAADGQCGSSGQLWDVRVVLDIEEDFKANPDPLSLEEALSLIEQIGRPVRFVLDPVASESNSEELQQLEYSRVLCSQLTEEERYAWFDDAKGLIENRGKSIAEMLQQTP